jgi:hypothetical protein
VSAYAFLAGRAEAQRPFFGSWRMPFGVPPDVALGRLALAVVFLAVPLFNPPIYEPGAERVYLGLPIALVAVVCSIRPVVQKRYGWVLLGWGLAALYALEAGLLRGDLSPGVLGNVYRPISAVVVFCACVVLLRDADRELWIRLFLLGGLIGCGLAVLHAMFHSIDPFGPSRPNIDSAYLGYRREEGAFSYPGNLGPYGAYVAVVGLVTMERLRVRPLWPPSLYAVSAVLGALAIAVSGSRAAALALFIAVIVIGVRSPRLRAPLVVGGVFTCALALLVLWVATPVSELVESRVNQTQGSADLRYEDWKNTWKVVRDNPVFGAGIHADTVDGTVLYLLGVGGIVGLLIVAAMYWVTVLRPYRFGDWTGLPLILGAVAISITQDVLGTPLNTWALAAGVFLLAAPRALYRE